MFINLNKFDKGTNTLIDEARLDKAMAKESVNLMLVQDGLWKVRWGTAYFGGAISGETTILGAAEYVTTSAREIIAIGGTGAIYKSTNDGVTFTQVGSITLDPAYQPYFLQNRSKLYITNGNDDIVLYNGTTATQYTSLSAPAWAGTPLAKTGLSGTTHTFYYQVTALNEVGETVGSTEQNIQVSLLREDWDASNYVTLDWNAVSGATRYQIYVSDESGYEVLLDDTADTGYVDKGQSTPNPFIEVPLDNTTGGPVLGPMTLSGNRVWGIASDGAVWFGGTGQFSEFFSAFYGGGYIYLEKGGRETAVAVKHFRTGSGNGIATVFTEDPSGRGSVWQISLETVTVEGVSFVVPIPTKLPLDVGASSALGVVSAKDDIYMASKKGINSLRSKPQLVNILSTDELSVPIRPSYRSLRANLHGSTSAIYFESKVFFSVGRSARNDTTIIYDTERNCWIYYWDIGARQFFEFTDANGKVHLLTVPVSGNQLIEWSEDFGNDLGEAIYTSFISPLVPVNDDRKRFARMREVLFELGRPVGSINVEVLGIEKKKGFSQLASKTINDVESDVDFAGDELFGDYEFSDPENAPTTYSQASVKKLIKLNKLVNHIQFRVWSTVLDTQYSILSIQASGAITSSKAPTNWN